MDRATLIRRLREAIGPDGVFSEPGDLLTYEYDMGFDAHPPDLVVLPHTAEEVQAIVRLCREEGIVFVPRFNRDEGVPDLSPLLSVHELERALLVAVARPLAQEAADLGVCLILEPFNRYEARFPKDLAEGASICAEVDSPGLRLMGDFFHMSIEEADIAASLRAAAPYLVHIHLADSNRQTPGRGHTQFLEPFRALREIGYQGFGALECRVPEPREESLRETVRFLRSQLRDAGW